MLSPFFCGERGSLTLASDFVVGEPWGSHPPAHLKTKEQTSRIALFAEKGGVLLWQATPSLANPGVLIPRPSQKKEQTSRIALFAEKGGFLLWQATSSLANPGFSSPALSK